MPRKVAIFLPSIPIGLQWAHLPPPPFLTTCLYNNKAIPHPVDLNHEDEGSISFQNIGIC
jgi:hypothetical protein